MPAIVPALLFLGFVFRFAVDVPCLKDTETGEIKETVVFKIESRSFLKKFNEKNGWGKRG